MVSLTFYAQDTLPTFQYYYVEEKTPDLLKPTSKNRLADHSLNISISRSNLQSFFDAQTVYVYKKAFPGAINPRLQNMYLIGLDDDNVVNPLRDLSQVVYADYIGIFEENTLDTEPDDYINNNIPPLWTNGVQIPASSYKHLELVNAKQAWNITTGNSNVEIGIIDVDHVPTHPDISNKTLQHYGGVWSGVFPRPHGLRVASCAAADTNNFDIQGNPVGIASIGFDSSLITVQRNNSIYTPPAPHPFDNATTAAEQALYLAQNHPNIKVINYSHLESCSEILANGLVFEEIWYNYNVTIVAAAGNGDWQLHCPDGNGGTEGYVYPASHEHVISVTSVGHHNCYGEISDFGFAYGWKDVHEFVVGNNQYTHTHNDKVDISAPGYHVPLANGNSGYLTGYGTSYASPFVAGIVALMYDVYPNITPDEVMQILKDTADDIYHIPENQQYIGKLGAGRVNAYAAVRTAECLANPTSGIDLMTLNSDDDFGDEPDTNTNIIWESDDIWVRNQNDGFLAVCHEDLQYVDENTPVYIYVRVTNDGCTTSSGNDVLKLYWAKGGLNRTWPTVWEGDNNPQPAPNGTSGTFDIGEQVGGINGGKIIPSLKTGESTIIEFEWYPKNPDDYENAGFSNPWMFCFLSRILSDDEELLPIDEGPNAATNARNNNNIAYKNTTVINVSDTESQGTIFAGNLGGETTLQSDIQFYTNNTHDDNIWQDAEVYATLNENLWNAWQDSGAQQQNIRVANQIERRLLLTGNNASLNDIDFDSQEFGTITMSVNFLIKEVEDFEGYDLHLSQTDSSTDEELGGFSYTFTRNNDRQEFIAENETEIEDDNSRTIRAIGISENATYNWYDKDGNLIYSGNELTVSTAVAKEYKLEVIADSDGHKDYKTIVTEDIREITSISPNPASNQTTIKYLIDQGDTAIIMLSHTTNGTFYNYILDSTANTLTIDLLNLSTGQYIVNLISGGQVLDKPKFN